MNSPAVRTPARILTLPRAFPSRDGVPVIRAISTDIFTRTYFTHCLQCGFCNDQCCSYGVDVDVATHERIMQRAPELERATGIPRRHWFRTPRENDPDFPGGGTMRTRVRNGRCVFLNRSGRGCAIHAYALREGFDYHELKSIVDCLFPLTWEDGVLCGASEVEDDTLACLDQGPSLYRGARGEVLYYVGEEGGAAIDDIERRQGERQELLAG